MATWALRMCLLRRRVSVDRLMDLLNFFLLSLFLFLFPPWLDKGAGIINVPHDEEGFESGDEGLRGWWREENRRKRVGILWSLMGK